MKTVVVIAGIVRKINKILLAQRLPDDKNHPLLWEFPGGKLELGEEPEECLVREIKEELGIEISVDDIFKVVTFQLPEKNIVLLVYNCTWLKGEPQKIQCANYAWVTPQELLNYDLVPADTRVMQSIVARYN